MSTKKILNPRVTHRKYPNGTVKSIAYTIEFSTGIVKYAGVLYRAPSEEDRVKEEVNYASKIAEWTALGGHSNCDANSICRSVPKSSDEHGKVLNCSRPKNSIGNTRSWNRHLHAQEALSRYRQNPIVLNFGRITPVLYFYQYRRLEDLIFDKLFHVLGVCDNEALAESIESKNNTSASRAQVIVSTYRRQLFNPELTPEEQDDYNRWLLSGRNSEWRNVADILATTTICTAACFLMWGTVALTLFLVAKVS